MKKGDKFIHKVWLDGNNIPLKCIITCVRDGYVYWKREGGVKSEMKFLEKDAHKSVKIDS